MKPDSFFNTFLWILYLPISRQLKCLEANRSDKICDLYSMTDNLFVKGIKYSLASCVCKQSIFTFLRDLKRYLNFFLTLKKLFFTGILSEALQKF